MSGEKYETLEDLITARKAGKFAGRWMEVVVDNDSVRVALYDRPPEEWGDDEDIEPEYICNLGNGSPHAALVEALTALGFEARGA